jgi:hypothetical protein
MFNLNNPYFTIDRIWNMRGFMIIYLFFKDRTKLLFIYRVNPSRLK